MTGSLRVVAGARSWQFDPSTTVLVGRGLQCDVVLDDPRVSRTHARIEYRDGWIVHDLSARGVWAAGETVQNKRIAGPLTLRFADPVDGPTLLLEVNRQGRPSTLTVGRAVDNDIVVRDPMVSRHHARLDRVDGGWQLIDLGSRNTTLVNGTPIAGPTVLADGDRFTVGGTDIRLHGEEFTQVKDEPARLVVDEVSYTLSQGNRLLSQVDLDLGPGDLVAVVGPSGAGKSTLLKVLTGELTPTSGRVTYDGYDVHGQAAAVATRIGVVPQDDVVHRRLTARRALMYAAKLRLPEDTSAGERRQRVDNTLAELGLTEHADKRVEKLSGGQRKRVSMALELLTRPSLLMLDEPTSGLDPALDKRVMAQLRSIADAGRTVVVVTHNVANLELCDRVIVLAPGGIPLFSGPPSELRGRFGTSDWAEIFTRVVNDRTAVPPPPTRREPVPRAPSETPVPRRCSMRRQTSTLVGRHLRLVFADKGYALFLLAVPIVLAVLSLAVPGHHGFGRPGQDHPTEASQLLVLLFVGAAFTGGATAAREVIGERAIFLRERSVGLRPTAYALAKVLVFALISAAQAALLVGTVTVVKPGPGSGVLLPSSIAELGVAVWATALASCLLSLLGSALVRSSEQTMPVLVVTVMAQLVLCGGMIPVTDRAGLSELAWLAPARWGYAAGASTVDLTATKVPAIPDDQLWAHSAPWWLLSLAVLVVACALHVALLTVRVTRMRRG
jgi:ABC-type multidrug transport system ATPase subunit